MLICMGARMIEYHIEENDCRPDLFHCTISIDTGCQNAEIGAVRFERRHFCEVDFIDSKTKNYRLGDYNTTFKRDCPSRQQLLGELRKVGLIQEAAA